jgi:hypothetical protein
MGFWRRQVDRERWPGITENIVTVARWSREELDEALRVERLHNGPCERTLPDGRVQYFASVYGCGPCPRSYGRADTRAVLREYSRADLRAGRVSDDERRRLCWGDGERA